MRICLVLVICASACAHGQELSLSGKHAFESSDRPEYAAADFNDAPWKKIRVPASWDQLGFEQTLTRGWYRIHFSRQPWMDAQPVSVLLGPVSDADEVWLNGHPLGGTGKIAEHYQTSGQMVRLYDLPPAALQAGDNVLAIRVQRVYYAGGLLPSAQLRPAIGSTDVLALRVIEAQQHATLARTVIFTVWLLAVLLGLLLFRTSVLRPAFRTLALVMALNVVSYSLELPFWVASGWHSPWVETLHNLLLCAVPLLYITLAQQILNLPRRRWASMAAAAATACLLAAALQPASQRVAILVLCLVATLLTGLTLLITCLTAIRRQRCGARIFSAGTAALVLPTLAYSLPGTMIYLEFVPLDVYAAACFAICCFAVLMSRYHQLHQQLESTSRALLSAEQLERSRISRDIHDGVSQSLLALKLGLQQQLLPPHDDRRALALQRLISDTESVSEELRDIVMALRPGLLDNATLPQALRRHADAITQRTGIEIELDLNDCSDIAAFEREQLLRIFQELIQNALKHSEARRLHASLRVTASEIRLSFHDDGQGIAASCKDAASHGLRTIRERVQMLGGQLVVSTHPATGGFAVQIDCPQGHQQTRQNSEPSVR